MQILVPWPGFQSRSPAVEGQSLNHWTTREFPVNLSLMLLSHISRVQLCDPIDSSPPGSPVPGILQARTLEWVAISFSNVWKWKVKVKSLSCVQLLATPWTVAYQAPLSMGFSRQEDWSGVPLPSPPRQFNNWYESFSFWLTNIESLGNRTWIITSSWSICHYPAMKLNLESSGY